MKDGRYPERAYKDTIFLMCGGVVDSPAGELVVIDLHSERVPDGIRRSWYPERGYLRPGDLEDMTAWVAQSVTRAVLMHRPVQLHFPRVG